MDPQPEIGRFRTPLAAALLSGALSVGFAVLFWRLGPDNRPGTWPYMGWLLAQGLLYNTCLFSSPAICTRSRRLAVKAILLAAIFTPLERSGELLLCLGSISFYVHFYHWNLVYVLVTVKFAAAGFFLAGWFQVRTLRWRCLWLGLGGGLVFILFLYIKGHFAYQYKNGVPVADLEIFPFFMMGGMLLTVGVLVLITLPIDRAWRTRTMKQEKKGGNDEQT